MFAPIVPTNRVAIARTCAPLLVGFEFDNFGHFILMADGYYPQLDRMLPNSANINWNQKVTMRLMNLWQWTQILLFNIFYSSLPE